MGSGARGNVEGQPTFSLEAGFARFLLRQRRRRDDMLGARHFSDPVWDMMLDLFAAQVRGEEVAISSLIIAASVSQSTALRRIRRLVRDGHFLLRDDPHDGRRTFVTLSDELFGRIATYLTWSLSEGRDVAALTHPPAD